ncbi:MAG: regulator of chromosome condensation 1/beta-lactamase-inhibitor protein II [Benniella sp.]|nr:MAG: regulator of chromosome condensation 1/beta-lactamase-inhibitor protein II [Benniella sp.]
MFIAHATRAHARNCVIPQRFGSAPALIPTTWSRVKPHSIQTRPILSWLFNPKEEPVAHKQLTPLKLNERGQRLLFWDSTHTTPNLKPEFNGRTVSCLSTGIAHSCAVVDGNIHVWGSNYYSQVGLTTETLQDDDSEDVTDVHFVNQLANEEVVQVASGNFHNLALSKTGKLWSWGSGCLGRGDEIYDSLPQPVEFFHALGRNVKQIFAAGNYSMVLATPKNGYDDELYIWGYLPFGEENEDGEVVPVMRKSLRPLLITAALGYYISHVACSPWHFTIAATPVLSPSEELDKPLLMTFGRHSDVLPLEKPYSPMYLDLPPEDEFYDIKPWRTFHSGAPTSGLAIKKIAASKGCDIILMENGSIGVSDHEDLVARLIYRPLDSNIVDVAGGSAEVIAIAADGQVLSWCEPQPREDSSSPSLTPSEAAKPVDANPAAARFNARNINPSALHPLLDFTKDEKKAETEVLAFFDSQRLEQEQKTLRLVEALFESNRVIVEKPGLSKCAAQYDRFTIC